jgi:ADP-ribose pyrophosphatase YjhB (NUDIX family)
VEPRALGWARRIQAIAQVGLEFASSPYDRDRYASLRALAVEILAEQLEPDGETTEARRLRLEELFASGVGYPTPKIDVRALVRRDGRVLLVQERVDGRWALPGGWADVGASPRENVEREVAEEAGCTVRARRLLAVFDRSRHAHPPTHNYVYKLCVACDHVTGEPGPGTETLAAGWFTLEELPPLSPGRILADQIRLLVDLDDHPEQPPYLD